MTSHEVPTWVRRGCGRVPLPQLRNFTKYFLQNSALCLRCLHLPSMSCDKLKGKKYSWIFLTSRTCALCVMVATPTMCYFLRLRAANKKQSKTQRLKSQPAFEKSRQQISNSNNKNYYKGVIDHMRLGAEACSIRSHQSVLRNNCSIIS